MDTVAHMVAHTVAVCLTEHQCLTVAQLHTVLQCLMAAQLHTVHQCHMVAQLHTVHQCLMVALDLTVPLDLLRELLMVDQFLLMVANQHHKTLRPNKA